MTVFFTICALTRPSTSVRKSSRRSDQRRPPRATGPKRRCTPSTRGAYTQISRYGTGLGKSGTWCESNLKLMYRTRRRPSHSWKKLVRNVASITATKLRRMRSSSRLATFSSSMPIVW